VLAVKGRGFSLPELLAVMAIAGVLAAMAAPACHAIIRGFQLRAAVSDLYQAIDLTRSEAISRGGRVQLVPLDAAGANWSGGWVVFVDANADRRPGPGEEVIATHGPVANGIVITANFTSNRLPQYIAFNSNGRGCSDTSSLAARWGSLSLHQDERIRRIRINMLGRTRVCDAGRDGAGCGP
jgi:type IV fimbrial biogenesis protein FimT